MVDIKFYGNDIEKGIRMYGSCKHQKNTLVTHYYFVTHYHFALL